MEPKQNSLFLLQPPNLLLSVTMTPIIHRRFEVTNLPFSSSPTSTLAAKPMNSALKTHPKAASLHCHCQPPESAAATSTGTVHEPTGFLSGSSPRAPTLIHLKVTDPIISLFKNPRKSPRLVEIKHIPLTYPTGNLMTALISCSSLQSCPRHTGHSPCLEQASSLLPACSPHGLAIAAPSYHSNLREESPPPE